MSSTPTPSISVLPATPFQQRLAAPSTPTSTSIPKKRIGGVISDEEAWVGGSNINPPTMSVDFGQRCPLKFSNATEVQKTCSAGISDKLGKEDEDTGISLTMWIELLASNIVKQGMDTVFCIPNSTWTSEVFILEDWGTTKMETCKAWVRELQSGVFVQPQKRRYLLCAYDLQALDWSASCILLSLTPALHSDVL